MIEHTVRNVYFGKACELNDKLIISLNDGRCYIVTDDNKLEGNPDGLVLKDTKNKKMYFIGGETVIREVDYEGSSK